MTRNMTFSECKKTCNTTWTKFMCVFVQYCLYPNNRMRIYDNSITPETPKIPDFKVSTVYYQVENGHDRDGLGSEENYFWKTAKERSLDVSVGAGNTDMNVDFYGGDFKIDLNEPELG